MDNPGYVSLARGLGLSRALDAVANNLANMSTTGFRAERVEFGEYVKATEDALGSVSMAEAHPRYVDTSAGSFSRTGGALDVAIDGDGYLQVETPDGLRLTRAGAFTRRADGQLVTVEGYPVLDAAGGPLLLPAGQGPISIGLDGTVSAGGEVAGQLAVVTVADPKALRQSGGALLRTEQPVIGAEGAKVMQGFLEDSNVTAMREISRMIDVQRAYEVSINLMAKEDERIRQAVRTFGQSV